jgi:hypothetical protein
LSIGNNRLYPDLLDVGAEELIAGLESGAWTSVDLTKVCGQNLSGIPTHKSRHIFFALKKRTPSFTQ